MSSEYDEKNLGISSSEISQLWITYIANSMSNCVLSYFLETAEDPEVSSVVKYALNLSGNYMSIIKDILSKDNFPVPEGFSEEDVNLKAKKLFSDVFMLRYMKYLTELGLINYGMSLTFCPRKDIRELFTYCIDTTSKLSNMLDDVELKKGVYVHYPHIPMPDKIEFVTKKSFLTGLLPEKRPLNSSEITNIFHDIKVVSLTRALTLGFNQVTKSEQVKNFLSKGLDLSTSHIEALSPLLSESDLPIPMTLEAEVLDSKEAPFSDKLIMFHIVSIMGYKTAIFGISMAVSMRSDIYATYAKIASDIGGYAKDGMDIMIKEGWLEKNPEAVDRKKLAKL